MLYPVFRKYSNNKSYFKVLNANEFEEITVLASNFWIYRFEAKILPDRYLIHDMIELEAGRWESITEKEYEHFKNYCIKEYKKQN